MLVNDKHTYTNIRCWFLVYFNN